MTEPPPTRGDDMHRDASSNASHGGHAGLQSLRVRAINQMSVNGSTVVKRRESRKRVVDGRGYGVRLEGIPIVPIQVGQTGEGRGGWR